MAAILVCSIQTVPAAVDDNLNSAFTILSQFLGINKKSSVPETKDIFDTASLVERVNYLEKQNRELSTAIQTSTNTIVEAVGESTAATTASYNLFVYFPASDALCSHEGVKVTITSPSGNQRSSTTLKSSNGNYSGTLYFNFSGNCQLAWTATNEHNEHFDITEDITISNSSQEFKLGSVAHRLRVYFPKDVALYSYENENISLVAGGKTVSSKLRLKGSNYEAVFYSDYDGTANLKYDFLDETGTRVAIEEPLNLNASKMDLEIGLNSLEPSQMSWKTIHTICQSNRASLFFKEGDKMPGGEWVVVGFGKDDAGKDALKLWRKKAIGTLALSNANAISMAEAYRPTWNTENGTNVAFKSELLSKSDVESGYCYHNRCGGIITLTATTDGNGRPCHYVVASWGSGPNGTSIVTMVDAAQASGSCYPCVWIH